MIEENKHIDTLFAEKLSGRTFKVPEAFLADLEKRLDAPKVGSKRIAGFWFWLSAIAISALATGAYFAISPSQSYVPVVSVAKSPLLAMNSTPMSTSSAFIEVQNQNSEKSFVSVEKYKNAPQAFTSEKQKVIQKVKLAAVEKARQIQVAKRAAEKLKAEQLAAAGNSGLGKPSNGLNVFGSSPTGEKNAGTAEGQKEGMNDIASNGSGFGLDETSIPNNSALFNLLKKDPSFGAENGKTKILQYRQENINYVDDTLKKVRYIIRDSVVIRDSIIFRDSLINKEVTEDDTHGIKPNNSNKNWELQAFGGFMSVRPKIQSPFQSYSDQLKSKEATIMTPNFGFALSMYYKNFRFGTGAEYYHFGEDFDYSTLNTTSVFNGVFFDTVTTYLDSSGLLWDSTSQIPPFDTVTTISMDSLFINDSTTADFKGNNVYSRFVIPLNFGYQFNVNDWSFTPRVGLNFEFTTAYRKGLYTNALNEEILEIDQRKFGLSYRLQFEIRRNFERFHLYVGPYYQNNIGYVIDSPDLKRKYGGFGAQFGVGVRF